MNKPKTILLTANGNVGVGFWTSICLVFGSLFGVQSINYTAKHKGVQSIIISQLNSEMAKYPEYDFSDFRIVNNSSFFTVSFVGTVIGVLNEAKDN